MFTVNEIIEKHLPQVSNKPWLHKSTHAVLRYLLHEGDIIEFGARYPFVQGLDFVEQVLDYFNVSYSVRDNEKESNRKLPRFPVLISVPSLC